MPDYSLNACNSPGDCKRVVGIPKERKDTHSDKPHSHMLSSLPNAALSSGRAAATASFSPEGRSGRVKSLQNKRTETAAAQQNLPTTTHYRHYTVLLILPHRYKNKNQYHHLPGFFIVKFHCKIGKFGEVDA